MNNTEDRIFFIAGMICLVLLIIYGSGCSHCSVTRTEFDGKTSGLNPYGTGDIEIVRESFWQWGKAKCKVALDDPS